MDVQQKLFEVTCIAITGRTVFKSVLTVVDTPDAVVEALRLAKRQLDATGHTIEIGCYIVTPVVKVKS